MSHLYKILACSILLLSPFQLFSADKADKPKKYKSGEPLYPCSYEHPSSAGPCATSPLAIYEVMPEYTEEARQAKLAGEVVLSLTVGKKGLPSDIHVVKSLGKGLDEQAAAAVEQWKFTPGTYKDHAEPVIVNLSFNFQHCDAPGVHRLFPAPGTSFALTDPEEKATRKVTHLYECGSGVGLNPKMACAPELLHAPDLLYTDEAKHAGLQGVVLLSLTVNTWGSAHNIRVIQSLGKAVDEQAIAAVRQWKFKPALYDEVPISVDTHVALEFGACRIFTVSAGAVE